MAFSKVPFPQLLQTAVGEKAALTMEITHLSSSKTSISNQYSSSLTLCNQFPIATVTRRHLPCHRPHHRLQLLRRHCQARSPQAGSFTAIASQVRLPQSRYCHRHLFFQIRRHKPSRLCRLLHLLSWSPPALSPISFSVADLLLQFFTVYICIYIHITCNIIYLVCT